MISKRGIVYTFYSFKGGVGRSMALANVAAILSKGDNRILIVDWDLEAPGLEKYFNDSISGPRAASLGIVDLITSFGKGETLDWKSGLLYAKPFLDGKQISILTAGQDTDNYIPQLQAINWDTLFSEKGLGVYLEQLREEWLSEYDFVLIDSRTGITDIGGICTIHFPDALILFFTANEQSVSGIKDVITRVWEKYKKIPLDRSKLLAVPVPSRFETITEIDLTLKWKGIFAETFADIYQDWIPDQITPSDILEKLFIPYIPYWSFGEGLPVVTEGTADPRSLGFAYELLARLLANRLQWRETFSGEINTSTESSPKLTDLAAESMFNKLNIHEQYTAKQIILRLINYDVLDDENNLPKKVPADFFSKNDYVVERLIRGRIIFKNFSRINKAPFLELRSRDIINNWQRLKQWITEDHKFLTWRQDLNMKASEWDEIGKDNAELLTGSSLKRAEKYLTDRHRDLIPLEIQFIRQSINRLKKERVSRWSIILALSSIIFIAGFTVYRKYVESRQLVIENEKMAKKNLSISAKKDSLSLADQTKYSRYQQDMVMKLQAKNDSLLILLNKVIKTQNRQSKQPLKNAY